MMRPLHATPVTHIGALLAAVALLLASCGGADTAPISRVRLVQADSSVGLAAYKVLEDTSVPISLSPALALTGLRVGGALLPSLDRFGTTPYIEIPSGTHDLPGLPIGDFGSLAVQSVSFAPGASVSLIRSPRQPGWVAVVEQPSVLLDAGQAEITLLDVTMKSIAAEVQGKPAKLYLTGLEPDDPFIAEYPLTSAEPLRNLRVPARGFRMTVQGDSVIGGPVVFRSGAIRLAQGTHWSGTLHLTTNASGQSLVLYSESTPDLAVVIDERAKMRVINAASGPVVTRVAVADRGAFIALPVGTMEEHQPLLPGSSVFVYTPQNDNPTPVYQSLTLPPPVPGRGYDIVVRDGATRGTLAASVHRHVAAPAATGTGSCWSLRILHAQATDRTVTITGRIASDANLFPGDPTVPIVMPPLAPSDIGVFGSLCGSAAARFSVTQASINLAPAALIRLPEWPPSPYAHSHVIGVVASDGLSTVMVPPINAILVGNPFPPMLRIYPRTP